MYWKARDSPNAQDSSQTIVYVRGYSSILSAILHTLERPAQLVCDIRLVLSVKARKGCCLQKGYVLCDFEVKGQFDGKVACSRNSLKVAKAR